MATRVGFIGLGHMGEGMARNLVLRGGRNLLVWNRTEKKSHEFANSVNAATKNKESCLVAETPRNVVEECDLTFSMLSTSEVSRAIFYRGDGVLAGISQGKSLIDCATIKPIDMQSYEIAVRNKQGQFLEAPVSGSKGPAKDGTLIFLCGGNKNLYEEVKPLFEKVMGKASFHLGDVGKGSTMKIIVNMIMGSMMASFAEGIKLAQRKELGLKPQDLLQVLSLGAMNNPMFNLKGPKMITDDFAPAFPLQHAQKDMRLAVSLGDKLGQQLPMAATANELYKMARGLGYGEKDFSAVLKALKSEE